MAVDRLANFLNGFVEAIETCRDKQLVTPTLVLIYTAIDILGSLVSSEAQKDFELKKAQGIEQGKFGTRHSFCFWVDSYMEPQKYFGDECRSIEIYGARCGLLHELRLESDMSRNKGARIIAYASGIAKVEDLKKAIALEKKDYIAVHVDQLINVFKNGVSRFLSDENIIHIIGKKSDNFVANLSPEIMAQFLDGQERI